MTMDLSKDITARLVGLYGALQREMGRASLSQLSDIADDLVPVLEAALAKLESDSGSLSEESAGAQASSPLREAKPEEEAAQSASSDDGADRFTPKYDQTLKELILERLEAGRGRKWTAPDMQKQLASEGFVFSKSAVSVAFQELYKKKQLQRLKAPKASKAKYGYKALKRVPKPRHIGATVIGTLVRPEDDQQLQMDSGNHEPAN
jgi:hypothetical protein